MPTILVEGMHCTNCKKSVEEAVQKISGVISAHVSLEKKELSWVTKEDIDLTDAVKKAICSIGFVA